MNRFFVFVSVVLVCGISMVSCDKKTVIKFEDGSKYEMVAVPGKEYLIGKTEITQEVYETVMGENPSFNKQVGFPAENLSWFDSLVFCNKLSVLQGKRSCYSVKGETDVSKWDYVPHQHKMINDSIEYDETADGYHIPTMEEWDYAILGGEKYMYSGSDDLDAVAWTDCNAKDSSHKVATLKPNGYGIYDMSGNVLEW